MIDGEKRVVDISIQGARGRIVALPTDRRTAPIYVERTTDTGDAWTAWSNGFELEESAAALRIAQHLVASGLAVAV
jgi:hypothetical protein